jgi:FkbM family methyltransferase
MTNLKNWLKRHYHLYNGYLFFFNRSYYQLRKKEKQFFKQFVAKGDLVYDVGANIGDKVDSFLQLKARVIAIEPDPINHKRLRSRFKHKPHFTLVPFAASDNNGVANFYVQVPGSAFNTMSQKWKFSLETAAVNRWETSIAFNDTTEIKTTTLNTLIAQYGKPSFIKIDVEGHELSCLKGLTQKIKTISFEANLPEFKAETLEIVQLLKTIDANVRFKYILSGYSFAQNNTTSSAEEFYSFLQQTEERYMEIYSFMEEANANSTS